VLGSGYRATIDALTGDQRAHVRDALVETLAARSITELAGERGVCTGPDGWPTDRRMTISK
jgi:hypothetical protein